MSARRPLSPRGHLNFCSSWPAPRQQSRRTGSAATGSNLCSECRFPRPHVEGYNACKGDFNQMKSSYAVVIVSAATALATALLLAPLPAHGQLNEKDKAFKAK